MMAGFDPRQLIEKLKAAGQRGERAAVQAVAEFAEHVMAESQELCPVSPIDAKHRGYTGHSGALRDSGTVKDPVVKGGTISVELGYNTNYAAAVHERLDASHQYPGAVNPKAQAKFLETPMRSNHRKFLEYVAERLAEELRE